MNTRIPRILLALLVSSACGTVLAQTAATSEPAASEPAVPTVNEVPPVTVAPPVIEVPPVTTAPPVITPPPVVTAPTPPVAGTGDPGVIAKIQELRAGGMGWGQAAHAAGVKLGPIVSGHTELPAVPVSALRAAPPAPGGKARGRL